MSFKSNDYGLLSNIPCSSLAKYEHFDTNSSEEHKIVNSKTMNDLFIFYSTLFNNLSTDIQIDSLFNQIQTQTMTYITFVIDNKINKFSNKLTESNINKYANKIYKKIKIIFIKIVEFLNKQINNLSTDVKNKYAEQLNSNITVMIKAIITNIISYLTSKLDSINKTDIKYKFIQQLISVLNISTQENMTNNTDYINNTLTFAKSISPDVMAKKISTKKIIINGHEFNQEQKILLLTIVISALQTMIYQIANMSKPINPVYIQLLSILIPFLKDEDKLINLSLKVASDNKFVEILSIEGFSNEVVDNVMEVIHTKIIETINDTKVIISSIYDVNRTSKIILLSILLIVIIICIYTIYRYSKC